MEDDQTGDESSYSISPPPWSPQRGSLSQTIKAETLAHNLDAQFQPVLDPSFPAVIETFDMTLRSYFLSPASEPHLTTPGEVHDANRGFKVSKPPGPNDIPNRALKHLPKRAVSLLVHIFNAVLRTHRFPQTWKHARVTYSNRPIGLFDTIGKLFEKILVARILHVVNERGLMQDDLFGFRHRHSTSLQLARHVERITRNFGEEAHRRRFPRRG